MSALDGLIAGYLGLLKRYHKTLDLLSAQGLAQVDRLVVDAKAYAKVIAEHAGTPAPTVLDVGSGAGLPGVVIALALPESRVYLVERRRRRAAFLQLVAGRLGLESVTVVNRDVRRLEGVCADVVSAQAVAEMADVVRVTRHLQADPCLLVSRRGPDWEREVQDVRVALGAAGGRVDRTTYAASAVGIEAEGDAAVAVLAVEPLEQRGSLVALRLAGGPACRSSA